MPKYNDKKKDSFKTRYRLFLFEMAFKNFTAKEIVENLTEHIKEFEEFEINKPIINAYAANYYQKYYDEKIKYKDYNELTVDDIWHSMNFEQNNLFQLTEYRHRRNINEKYVKFYNKLEETYIDIFKGLFPKEKFDEMIKNKVCSYCGISVDDINSLGNDGKLYNKRSETRGYTLEIDRKEANGEYTEDNCCMCCYWCNNAKTDEFKPHEFKEIARGINAVWNQRLKGERVVTFNDDAEIWKE